MSHPVFRVLAPLASAVVFAQSARAGVTVDLVFTEHNGSPISSPTVAASPGDTLVMAVRLHTDVALEAFGVSLDFDPGTRDELDVVQAFQWQGVTFGPGSATVFIHPETSLDPPDDPGALGTGRIQSFHGLSYGGVPAGSSYQIGTVTWTVTGNVGTNGADIESGVLKTGFDAVLDSAYDPIESLVQFNAATVNAVAAVPSLSPAGAAAAVALVLAGVAWATARARR